MREIEAKLSSQAATISVLENKIWSLETDLKLYKQHVNLEKINLIESRLGSVQDTLQEHMDDVYLEAKGIEAATLKIGEVEAKVNKSEETSAMEMQLLKQEIVKYEEKAAANIEEIRKNVEERICAAAE